MEPTTPSATLDILSQLVRFDTTSRNSNVALIDWIRDYLARHGIESRLSFDPSGSKANLHALIGPHRDGGLAFSGHVDTVPVDGQSWTTDPFQLHVAGGRAQARGACDMKGFVASMLAAVPDLRGMALQRPAHLFISFDEETTCDGARLLAADVAEHGPVPATCVVGEPTSMQPILAHKGRLGVRGTVRGLTGHSSRPEKGVNAVHAAAEIIAHLAAEGRRFAETGIRVPGFEPPHTTVHVGRISGGTILNIIPEHAEFDFEWRTVPGDDADRELDGLRRHLAATTERWMRAVDADTGITLEPFSILPSLHTEPDHPLVAAVKHATGANGEGKVSYGTEAGIYHRAGIATVVCGPGDIAQAHRPDEWIALEQLDRCDRFVRRMAETLLRP